MDIQTIALIVFAGLIGLAHATDLPKWVGIVGGVAGVVWAVLELASNL